MDAFKISTGAALQAGNFQNKEKQAEESLHPHADKAKESEIVRNELAEQLSKVQEPRKTDGDENGLKQSSNNETADRYKDAIEKIQEKIKNTGVNVQIEVDQNEGKFFLVIKNPETDEVLKQVPSENFISLINSLKEADPEIPLQGAELDVKY